MTITTIVLALLGWAGVAHTIATHTSVTAALVALAAAITLSGAAIAAASVNATGQMLAYQTHQVAEITDGHADRVDAITKTHSAEMGQQIRDLNWLAGALGRGMERARLDAELAAEERKRQRSPRDTGPFRMANRSL